MTPLIPILGILFAAAVGSSSSSRTREITLGGRKKPGAWNRGDYVRQGKHAAFLYFSGDREGLPQPPKGGWQREAFMAGWRIQKRRMPPRLTFGLDNAQRFAPDDLWGWEYTAFPADVQDRADAKADRWADSWAAPQAAMSEDEALFATAFGAVPGDREVHNWWIDRTPRGWPYGDDVFGGRDWDYYFRQGEEEAWDDGSARNPYKRGWQYDAWEEGARYAEEMLQQPDDEFGGKDDAYYFAKGREAFWSSVPLAENPYKIASWQHNAWGDGWRHAEATYRPERPRLRPGDPGFKFSGGSRPRNNTVRAAFIRERSPGTFARWQAKRRAAGRSASMRAFLSRSRIRHQIDREMVRRGLQDEFGGFGGPARLPSGWVKNFPGNYERIYADGDRSLVVWSTNSRRGKGRPGAPRWWAENVDNKTLEFRPLGSRADGKRGHFRSATAAMKFAHDQVFRWNTASDGPINTDLLGGVTFGSRKLRQQASLEAFGSTLALEPSRPDHVHVGATDRSQRPNPSNREVFPGAEQIPLETMTLPTQVVPGPQAVALPSAPDPSADPRVAVNFYEADGQASNTSWNSAPYKPDTQYSPYGDAGRRRGWGSGTCFTTGFGYDPATGEVREIVLGREDW